jgi:transposase InsO family protein
VHGVLVHGGVPRCRGVSLTFPRDCWDNAVAESFFATLKKELVRDVPFDSRAHARSEVFEYVEVFYNRRRAHSALGYESPMSFESCGAEPNVA